MNLSENFNTWLEMDMEKEDLLSKFLIGPLSPSTYTL